MSSTAHSRRMVSREDTLLGVTCRRTSLRCTHERGFNRHLGATQRRKNWKLVHVRALPIHQRRVGVQSIGHHCCCYHLCEHGVRLAELMSDQSETVPHGRWTGSASVFDAEAPRTQIVRRLPSLWRMRLARGDQADRLDVQYEVTDQTGRRDCLAASAAPESEVRVELRPIPPLIVSENADGVLLEGGLVLYIDLSSIRSAGVYSGTLTVTLNQL